MKRQQKTLVAFERLPEEFTVEDAMRCFQLNTEGAARSKIHRLICDHLVEKVPKEKRTGNGEKAVFRKTGVMML